MNHTPEPWHLPKGSTCMVSNSGEVPRSEANARRIVACVNACAGMNTESLESIAGRIAAKSVLQMHENYIRNKAKAQSLEQQRDALLAALEGLADDIHSLIHESSGVAGLHLNDDLAPWHELEAGGRFERLTHLPIAIEAIAAAKGGS